MVRGDLIRLPAPRGARGHEQRGARYAVVVQADELLALSTVILAPTSTSAPGRIFRPEITIAGEPTRVLVEQLRAVDAGTLGPVVGHLTVAELAEVEQALRDVLGL